MNDTRCVFFGAGQLRMLLDRHEPGCTGDCPGCAPCKEPHCWDDGATHLDFQHPLTCPSCLSRHRDLLEHIGDLTERLRERMVDHANSDIPGGNIMVLLGHGSEGAEWTADHATKLVPAYTCGDCWQTGILEPSRHLLDVHLSAKWLADAPMFTFDGLVPVEPQGNDNLLTDPQSVEFALMRVEEDWRALLGHPPEPTTLAGRISYLTRHIHWAAQRIDGYDGAWYPDIIEDMRQLRGRLVAELGDSDPTIRGVQCLNDDCGGTLLRRFDPADPCDHRADIAAAAVLEARSRLIGPLTHNALCQAVVDALDLHACDQGGRRDHWVCSDCGDEYPLDRYNRAVAQKHLEHQPLRTAAEIRQLMNIPSSTLRTWVERGKIAQHDNAAKPGRPLYDVNEVRRVAQAGGLLAG